MTKVNSKLSLSGKQHPRYKHGDRRGPYAALYSVWSGIKQRCYNPNNKRYDRYGARGIVVCEEWLSSYSTFKEWALSSGWVKGLTIEREYTDGNYEPNNCSFIPRKEQPYNHSIRKDNSSGFRGVYKTKHNRWQAQIKHVENNITVGTYATAIEAAKARNAYIIANKLPHKLALNI